MSQIISINLKALWVVCDDDEDINQEFGSSQFDLAKDYLNEMRGKYPQYNMRLIGEIDE